VKKYRVMEYRQVIIDLIELMEPKDKVYVECGVQKGYTFNAVHRDFKRAVAIDISQQWLDKIHNNPNVEKFLGSSSEFVKTFDGEIDLLFVDADHRKESVLSDFDNLSPYVKDTGLILLHDTYPAAVHLTSEKYCHNAWEAARDIHQKKKYKDWEIVTLPFPYAGLSIIRRAIKHLHWMESDKPKQARSRFSSSKSFDSKGFFK